MQSKFEFKRSKTINYYILEDSDEKVGTYPQIIEPISGNWDIDDPLSVYNQISYHKSPMIEPDFGILKLENRAKQTDILSCAMFSHDGFLMSPLAKKIFELHNLGNHWFYEVKVMHKKAILVYYLLHLNNSDSEYFDFQKSTFLIEQYDSSKEILLSSREEKEKILKDSNYRINIRPKELVFKNNYKHELDIVSNRETGIDLYISETLMDSIEKSKLTGLMIYKQSTIKLQIC